MNSNDAQQLVGVAFQACEGGTHLQVAVLHVPELVLQGQRSRYKTTVCARKHGSSNDDER